MVLLETTVPVTPVAFPREGLLDDLAARGGLRPGTLIDILGYGAGPDLQGRTAQVRVPVWDV